MVETKSPFREWSTIDEDHYDYNQMKVLLFEGVGGDVSQHEAHLQRNGIVGRSQVELTKFSQQTTRNEVTEAMV